jgi:hypothetical protein
LLAGKPALIGKRENTSSPFEPLPSVILNVKESALAAINASLAIQNQPEVRVSASSVDVFVVKIEKWSKQRFEEAAVNFERWLSRPGSDLTASQKTEREEVIAALDRLSDGQEVLYIYEVAEVQKGSYQGRWNSALSSSAKAELANVFMGDAHLSWISDQEMNVSISTNTRVAYKAHRFSPQRIKESVQANLSKTDSEGSNPGLIVSRPDISVVTSPQLMRACRQPIDGLKRPTEEIFQSWIPVVQALRKKRVASERDLLNLYSLKMRYRDDPNDAEDLFREAAFTLKCLEDEGELRIEALGTTKTYWGKDFKNQKVIFRD